MRSTFHHTTATDGVSDRARRGAAREARVGSRRASRAAWLLPVLVAIGPVRAEEIVVPLDGVSGAYQAEMPLHVLDIDLGLTLYRVDSVRMRWSGELTAGWGSFWGIECESFTAPLPAAFVVTMTDPLAFAWSPQGIDYPNTESFSSENQFGLFTGHTWAPLFDGRFTVSLQLVLDLGGFCNLTVIEGVSGVLDSAELIIEGGRVGDFDADGDIDAADREGFLPCHSGIGVPYESGCEAADFDLDGDVDCADWDRFGDAWTADGSPAPFSTCQYPLLELTPTELLWSPVEQAIGYDVVGGDLDALRNSAGDFMQAVDACIANDQPASALAFDGQPSPGEGWWFLVRAVADSGVMTYDCLHPSQVTSRDEAIDISTFGCP